MHRLSLAPISGFLALWLSANAFARDVVIPPVIDPPAASLQEMRWAPAIDRSSARELARVRLEQASGPDADGAVLTLAEPLALRSASGSVASDVALTVAARIEIEGADAHRMRFRGVPEGTVLWIAGSDDAELVRFDPPSADAWGPTTHGSSVIVSAEGPIGDAAIVALASVTGVRADSSACMEDVACPAASSTFSDVMDASRAIAYVRYVRDGQARVCTGALVADATGSRTPYLLTAAHCIDSGEIAASVEIIWDLRSSACGSNRMAAYSRSHGAELLVMSKRTDVALLKLNSIPSGRVFLGIDTRTLEAGTPVHRVSHASGLSQTFSAGVVSESGRTCASAPRPAFLYSKPTVGGVTGGSSGAPLLVRGLYVAGQLLGLCGADPTNPCATFNDMVDGSIRQSWSVLAPFLDPDAPRLRRRAMR